jgi:hypothetical protein
MTICDSAGRSLNHNDFVRIEKLPAKPYLDGTDSFYGDLQSTMAKIIGGYGRIVYPPDQEHWCEGTKVYVLTRIVDADAVKDVPVIVNAHSLTKIDTSLLVLAYFSDLQLAPLRDDVIWGAPSGSVLYEQFKSIFKNLSDKKNIY